MEGQFVIRPALISDAALVSDFAAEQFKATYGADTPPSDLETYISKSFTTEKQREEIESSDGHVLLAVSRDTIIGYTHVQFKADASPQAFLNRIYVEQSWKGKAVGSALLTEAIGKVRGLGAHRLKLTVYERNARAVAFYKRAGFDVIGTEVFLVGEDKQTDLVMEKLIL